MVNLKGRKHAREKDVENSYVYGELLGSTSNTAVTVVDKNQNNRSYSKNCNRKGKIQVCRNEAGGRVSI